MNVPSAKKSHKHLFHKHQRLPRDEQKCMMWNMNCPNRNTFYDLKKQDLPKFRKTTRLPKFRQTSSTSKYRMRYE